MNTDSLKYPKVWRHILPLATLCCVALTSCDRTPDTVLGKNDMASLMADIHIGEAVIDYNHSEFPTDSARLVLKQSIYAAHGVDQAMVDSSFVWYGNHIEDYIKVYDRTIEIIEERQRDLASAAGSQKTIAGDSVTIWEAPGHITVSEHMPQRIFTFSFTPDSTWHNGDIFMLRYVPVHQQGEIVSRLLVDYDNGTTGYVDDNSLQGIARVQRIQVDSTLTPVRVYGYMLMPQDDKAFEIDSVAMVRMRHYMLPNTYLSQRRFNNGINLHPELEDEMSNSPISGSAANMSGLQNAVPTRRREQHRLQHAAAQADDLPQSSANREQSEHRRTAAEHKATPESRRQAASRRQPVKRTPVQRQQQPSPVKRNDNSSSR